MTTRKTTKKFNAAGECTEECTETWVDGVLREEETTVFEAEGADGGLPELLSDSELDGIALAARQAANKRRAEGVRAYHARKKES